MIFQKEKDRIQDYKLTFGSPHGKRVLYDLINACNVLNTSFVANDPYASIYKEGRRAVVCGIMTKLSIKAEDLERLLKGEG